MLSRRTFLYGAGALSLTALAEAHDHVAKQLTAPSKTLLFFTPEEAREMEAVCAQIIPTDDSPGASEAGSIYFVDYTLSHDKQEMQPIFREGLKQLAATSAPKKFSDLSSENQIAALKKIESTDFFKRARDFTVVGFLSDPKYGGNRDELGWKYIQFENPGMWEPPFGYYDAELLKGEKKA
jgi:gluconate 2-dehydrogenase gamma chain